MKMGEINWEMILGIIDIQIFVLIDGFIDK